jgi:hypothetical protein
VWVSQAAWAVKVSAAVNVTLTGPLKDALLKSTSTPATDEDITSTFALDIVVRGDTAGKGSRIVLNLNGNQIAVPFCANDNHAQCAPDEACWGFVCIRKQDRLGFCTNGVQCLSGKCKDAVCADCVDTVGDTDCGAGTFCEAGLNGDR